MPKKGEKIYSKFDAAKIYLNAVRLDDMHKFFKPTNYSVPDFIVSSTTRLKQR